MEAVLFASDGIKLEEEEVSKAVTPGQPNDRPTALWQFTYGLSTKLRVPRPVNLHLGCRSSSQASCKASLCLCSIFAFLTLLPT